MAFHLYVNETHPEENTDGLGFEIHAQLETAKENAELLAQDRVVWEEFGVRRGLNSPFHTRGFIGISEHHRFIILIET